MNLAPIFSREVRAAMRDQRLRQERLRVGAITTLALTAALLAEQWVDGFNLKIVISMVPLGAIGPFLLLVTGLNLAGNLLSEERREGTLPLLLLTRLTGHDIVLGKLLTGLLLQMNVVLAALPALVMPLLAVGFPWDELCLSALGGLNVMFFAMALGLLGAVLSEGPKVVGFCASVLFPLLLFVHLFVLATPLGGLLPSGFVRECFVGLRWLNPGEALLHVQTAVGGGRASAYWSPLVASHALSWCLLCLAGGLLPHAGRWQAGANSGPRSDKSAGWWKVRWTLRSRAFRTRLLNRNPYHWLTSRAHWPTAQAWIWLAIPPMLFGWLAWVTWAGRGLNITVVLAGATATTWCFTLLILVPGEASRRLLEDRLNGNLELILCTPLDAREIIRGQWLSLRRRFLPPLLAVTVLDTALMITGYVTDGFGGMLDREDRGLWLFGWLGCILLLPLCLTALGWCGMRRALFARNNGEAGVGAFVQITVLPGMVLWTVYELARLAGWNAEGWVSVLLLEVAYSTIVIALASHARRVLYEDLRRVAAGRYFLSPRHGVTPVHARAPALGQPTARFGGENQTVELGRTRWYSRLPS